MAVTYTIHEEIRIAGNGQTILTFRDITATLTDDEGGGENPLNASELGFKSIIMCSNARNDAGEIIVASPSLSGSGLWLSYRPPISGDGDEEPYYLSSGQTGYNGTLRLSVVGIAA